MRELKYRKTDGERLRAGRHQRKAERVVIHVRKGDTVRVMRGDDRGKEGTVLRVYPKTGRVLVEGINIVKKHRRARRPEEQSGIIESPAPVDLFTHRNPYPAPNLGGNAGPFTGAYPRVEREPR